MIRHSMASLALAFGLPLVAAQTLPQPPQPTGSTVVFAGNQAFDRFVPLLRALPLPSCNGTSWRDMVTGMRNGLVRIPGSNWYQNPGACGIKLLVFNNQGALDKFAAFVVRDGETRASDMPFAQGDHWQGYFDAVFNDTIISISTDDLGALPTTDPSTPELIRSKFAAGASYGGMTELAVPRGAQLFSRARLSGALGNLLSGPLNLPSDNLWIRAELETHTVDLMLPPGNRVSGPFGITPITLSDVTFKIDRDRNMAFMGNAEFRSLPGKVLPMVIDAPVLVPKTWPRKWPASQIALNAPRELTMHDYAKIVTDLATLGPQAASQIGFMANIVPTQDLLRTINRMSRPLAMFKLFNPDPNADRFRLAAGTPYPDLRQFNFVVLGADATAKDGSNAAGPLLRFKADVDVFGQRLARSDTTISRTEFRTNSNGSFNIGLDSIGITSPVVNAVIDLGTSPPRADILLNVKSPVRDVSFVLNEDRIAASSPANCVFPAPLGGQIEFAGITPRSLVDGLLPQAPDPGIAVKCAAEVAALVADGINRIGRVFSGGSWQSHPARTTYDCTNFHPTATPESTKFIAAYPPGRLWGSRSDYDHRQMNFTRYIYSQATGKFHAIGEGALGNTACGGLVGEEGHGYGRTDTANSEIWTKALMCERGKFPQHLVAPGVINTPEQCYETRGLRESKPQFAGRIVKAQGDPAQSAHLIGPDGNRRLIGWKDNWKVHGDCELAQYRLSEIVLPSLHELFKWRDSTPLDGGTCKQLLAGMNIQMTPGKIAQENNQKFIAYCDSWKNTFIVSGNRRYWIGNKDNWNVYAMCKAPADDVVCVSAADVATVPDGGGIGDYNRCRELRGLPRTQPPAERYNARLVSTCDGRNDTFVVANGQKRWISNKDDWHTFSVCKNHVTEDRTCISHAELNIMPDGGPVNADQCRSLRGLPNPARIADLYNNTFVAYCDSVKNTSLVINGKHHWVSNKDNWHTFNNCKANPNEDVHCRSHAEIGTIPVGSPMNLQQCRAARGLR